MLIGQRRRKRRRRRRRRAAAAGEAKIVCVRSHFAVSSLPDEQRALRGPEGLHPPTQHARRRTSVRVGCFCFRAFLCDCCLLVLGNHNYNTITDETTVFTTERMKGRNPGTGV